MNTIQSLGINGLDIVYLSVCLIVPYLVGKIHVLRHEYDELMETLEIIKADLDEELSINTAEIKDELCEIREDKSELEYSIERMRDEVEDSVNGAKDDLVDLMDDDLVEIKDELATNAESCEFEATQAKDEIKQVRSELRLVELNTSKGFNRLVEYLVASSGITSMDRNGFTFDVMDDRTKYFDEGYAVSVTDNGYEYEDRREGFENIVNEWIRMESKQIRNGFPGKHFIGYWYDENTDRCYIDLTLRINEMENAVELAREYNQKSIYSFETEKTIPV